MEPDLIEEIELALAEASSRILETDKTSEGEELATRLQKLADRLDQATVWVIEGDATEKIKGAEGNKGIIG
jgi:hypothetical protein